MGSRAERVTTTATDHDAGPVSARRAPDRCPQPTRCPATTPRAHDVHRSFTRPTYGPAVSDSRVLFREFLRAPTRVATVTASSDALVAAMLAPLSLDGAPVVVELGAGTGRVTDALAARLAGRGRHVAVELNPELARRLAARHPGVTVVPGDAGDLPSLLRGLGVDRVDAVSSLLPWVAWSAPIADLAADVLAPTGTFTQVTLLPTTWMPPARRQERAVRDRFGEVGVSSPVWANLPPARVLVARRPATR